MSARARAGSIVIAAAVFSATFVLVQWWDFTLPTIGAATYQAVFLVNGQTFFGRYYDRLGPEAKIESVYYIQQSSAGEGQPAGSQLVQRGSELHRPLGRVLIPKAAILFVEDLRDDSPITRFMAEQERHSR